MDKKCSICLLEKKISDFYVKDKSTNRYHAQCKTCYKSRRTLHYKEHYEIYGKEYRERAKLRKVKVKREIQEKVYTLLAERCCEGCGFDDVRALEFDHIDPEFKSFGIARAISDCYSWKKIDEEIKKCRVLCANCHKIRTAQQQKWSKGRLGRVVRQDSAKVRTPVQIR